MGDPTVDEVTALARIPFCRCAECLLLPGVGVDGQLWHRAVHGLPHGNPLPASKREKRDRDLGEERLAR